MCLYSRLVFVAAAAVASSVLAADETWLGGTIAWGTAANWSGNSPKRVPATNAPFDFVVIPNLTLGKLYPVLSTSATVAGLSMNAGSQLTLDGTASGTKTLTVGYVKASTLNGTITLTGTNARLTLDTGKTDWTNGGTLEFGSGANFTATSGIYGLSRTLTNTGGTIRANAGSTVYIPFTTIIGGTLDGAWRARSTMYNPFDQLNFSSVTLGSGFTVVTDNSTYQAKLVLTDSVTNTSTLFNFPTDGTMTLASATSTFTFAGTGSLTMAGQSLGGTGVTTIANTDSHTLRGYGTLNASTVTNAGTIRPSEGTSGAPQTLSATAITSTGAIVVDQYNTLSASGAVLSDTGSTITMNGGTLSAGSLTNKGSLSGYGTIGDVNSSGSIRATGGTAGTGRILTTGNISGTGTVTVDQYNTLQSTGAVTSMAGSVFEANGTVTAPSVTIGGVLQGSGTIHSMVILAGTSILSPGNSPGVLTVDGLTVSDGAQYNFEVGDRVDVTGSLNFLPGATMEIHATPGLPNGNYVFLNADSVIGMPQFTLDDVRGTFYQDGKSFGFNLVPEPAVLGMAGVVGLLALTRRARAAATV